MRSKHTNFLRILSLLAAMPLLGVSVSAAQYQGGRPGGPRGGRGPRGRMSPDNRLKQMTKDFDLTADQPAKIKPILADEQKKMQDTRNDSSGDRQAMFQKMRQLRRDTNDQIRAQLNDKQKDKFDKIEKQRQENMQNRRRGGMRGPGGTPQD
jgi:protein CpxP